MEHPEEQTPKISARLWLEEPFRVFFPLGIVAAVFGLLLWPLHYAGYWEIYPAIQHPRILILGFGAAFVMGFLGTAWPRFVEAPPLRLVELVILIVFWFSGQVCYSTSRIALGDGIMAGTFICFMVMLGYRVIGEKRDRPPAALVAPFINLAVVSAVLLCWAYGVKSQSPAFQALFRLQVYQGFLLLPMLGVGSFFFPKFFDTAPIGTPKSRARVLSLVVPLIFGSFILEACGWIRLGNALRLGAVCYWAYRLLPMIWKGKAPGTRSWALRLALIMIATGFFCRIIWPYQLFAFEHLLFLGGFSQIMLLVADRVVVGHSEGHETTPARSLRWRWIVWIMVLTAATRATADLVPSTRVSHHIYAAVMLVVILILWWIENGGRLRRGEDDSGS
tara:strand:+ start:2827 stop:3999 length:1173 start_codon:yes stop_codon:yes gene_type:complete